MQLLPSLKLVAAIQSPAYLHRPPDPDPKASFNDASGCLIASLELGRLMIRKLISAGGGLVERKLKQITLTKQMAEAFDIDRQTHAQRAIHRLLKAPRRLLWNGGFGTFSQRHG